MATAGIAVTPGESIALDLVGGYSDLGEVRTLRGPGRVVCRDGSRVVWRDGSREPLRLDLAPTRARLAYSKSAFSRASGVSE